MLVKSQLAYTAPDDYPKRDMRQTTYDIAVLGATPAGFAAGGYLAGKHKTVAIIDAPRQACESPLADWVPKGFFQTPHLDKALAQSAGATPFSCVQYHNSDFSKQVDYHQRGAAGHVLHAEHLRKAMRHWAEKAGAFVTRPQKAHPIIHLQEDTVTVVGTPHITARYLLIAHSRPNDVIADLALPAQNIPFSPMVIAALDVPLPTKVAKALGGTLHIIDTPDRSDLGMLFIADTTLHVRLISTSPASGNRSAELSALLARIQSSGLLPMDLPLAKAKGAVWHPPAGVALELETHVAKRCLLTGTAGGFVESITGQTLLPSIRSALLSADMILLADKADDPQEALIQFKSAWRREMADYLRPPNTSLQMLLPLLFVNQQIAAKFTKALLYGESM